MTAPASTSPTASDQGRPSEHERFVTAWRRYESGGEPNDLLAVAEPLILARCQKTAAAAKLDPDEVVSETFGSLFRRQLAKRPTERCVNDEHCFGLFGIKLRYAIKDAIQTVRRRRGREENLADAQEQVPAVADPLLGRYLDADGLQHAMHQLELCRQSVLGHREATAFHSAYMAERPLTQAEISAQLNVSDRWVRSLITKALKKLRHCLQQRGVRL